MNDVYNKFISKISIYDSYDDVINVCQIAKKGEKKLNITFLNAHAFNLACRNKQFFNDILRSDLVLRDGIGVELLYKSIGYNSGINLNGTDLIPILLNKVFKNENVAIYGSHENELNKAKEHLIEEGFNIVGCLDGFKRSNEYLNYTKEIKPTLIVMAMGMPKQEYISNLIHDEFPNVFIINGGAIIDFIAGKVNRAPMWMRKVGLEWVYRLLNEPKRMFNRYVIGNFIFLFRAVIFKKEKI